MTDLQRHIAHVQSRPFDKVAALALADHFQEASGYNRWTALRKVAAVRRPGLDAHHIGRAAKLFASRRPGLTALFDLIYVTVGDVLYHGHATFIVRGHQKPRLCVRPSQYPDDGDWEDGIYVGARWVMHVYNSALRAKRQWALNLSKAEWLDR